VCASLVTRGEIFNSTLFTLLRSLLVLRYVIVFRVYKISARQFAELVQSLIRMFDRSIPRSKGSTNMKTGSDHCNSTVTWSRLRDRTYPFRSYRELCRIPSDTSDMFDIFVRIRDPSTRIHGFSVREILSQSIILSSSSGKENTVSPSGMIILSAFRLKALSACRENWENTEISPYRYGGKCVRQRIYSIRGIPTYAYSLSRPTALMHLPAP
jgi:hypothetical protein